MIFDKTNLFSDAQAITGDAVSENVIDFGTADTPMHAAKAISRDVGKGRKPEIRIQVVEDFNNLTSLAVSLQVDNDEAFGSPRVVSTVTVVAADLVAGAVIPPELMPRGVDERYARLDFNVNGTNPSAGKVTAGLVFANEERDV